MTIKKFLIPVYPQQNESCQGYFDRLAVKNGYMGGQTILNAVQSKLRYSSLHLPAVQKRVLSSLSPYITSELQEDLSKTSFGVSPDTRYRVKGLRVCPMCSENNVAHHHSFLSIYHTRCSRHGILLTDTCHLCKRRNPNAVVSSCVHCGVMFSKTPVDYSLPHQRLIDDLDAGNDKFRSLILNIAKFLARPFDLTETPLALRDLSVQQQHAVFSQVANFLYGGQFRQCYIDTFEQRIVDMQCLGQGEVEIHKGKLSTLLSTIERAELSESIVEQVPDIDAISHACSVAVNTDYYKSRLSESLQDESNWRYMVTANIIIRILHIESGTFTFLIEEGVFKPIKGKMEKHRMFHLGQIHDELFSNIKQSDVRAENELRLTDINTQVLSRFNVSLPLLIYWLSKGVVKARRVKLTNTIRALESIYIDTDALETVASEHYYKFDEDISLDTFAYTQCVRTSSILKAHQEQPFEGLLIDDERKISKSSIIAFNEKYISLARLAYLSKRNTHELKDYLDSVSHEKRVLTAKGLGNVFYRRNSQLEDILQNLRQQGKLQVKFRL